MQLLTRIEQLVHVTPSATARTAAHCLLAPHRGDGWPRWVNARDASGSLVAVVRVTDHSEAFVAVAKLVELLDPPAMTWERTPGPEISLTVAPADVTVPRRHLSVVAA